MGDSLTDSIKQRGIENVKKKQLTNSSKLATALKRFTGMSTETVEALAKEFVEVVQ